MNRCQTPMEPSHAQPTPAASRAGPRVKRGKAWAWLVDRSGQRAASSLEWSATALSPTQGRPWKMVGITPHTPNCLLWKDEFMY